MTIEEDYETGRNNESLQIVLTVFCSVSFVLSFFTVITYAAFKRKFPHTLPMCMALCCLFLSASLLIAPVFGWKDVLTSEAGPLCIIQASGIQFFGLLLACYFCAIASDLYLAVVLQKSKRERSRFHIWFHIVSLTASLSLTIVPGAFGHFGRRTESLWCWIQSTTEEGVWWQFLCFYVFVFIVTVIVCGLWVKVLMIVVAMQKANAASTGKLPSYLFRHILGVILFDLIFILMAIHRVYIVASGNKTSLLLLLGHEIGLGSVGLLTFLCFGLTNDNLRLWRDFLLCRPKYHSIS